jgi:TRAP-type C4-dicarboxylate transport system permease small subunit
VSLDDDVRAVGDPAPRWFQCYEAATKATNHAFVVAASLGVVFITVLVLGSVAARTAGAPILWPFDIAQFALAYVFFLGLGPALESGHHVVVEMFDRVMPRFLRPYVLHIAAVLTILFGAVLLWQLWRATSRVFADNRLAIASIVVALKWVYVVGPVGTIVFILSGVTLLGRAIWPTDETNRSGGDHA